MVRDDVSYHQNAADLYHYCYEATAVEDEKAGPLSEAELRTTHVPISQISQSFEYSCMSKTP